MERIENKILEKTLRNWNMKNAGNELPTLHDQCPEAYNKLVNAADDVISGVRDMLTSARTQGEIRSLVAGALYSTFLLGSSYSSNAIRMIAGDVESLCMHNESQSKITAYENGEVTPNEDDIERTEKYKELRSDADAILRSLGFGNESP